MTQPGSHPDDGPAPVNRRDVLRLGAAAFGVPLLTPATAPPAAAGQPPQVNVEASQPPDFPTWEAFPLWDGETYPGHLDPVARTVNNLMFMGLAMHNFAAMNDGRFAAPAIRKGDQPLLSWRVAILPFLEQLALYERFRLDEPWDSSHNASLLREMPSVYAPVISRETPAYTTHYQRIVGPGSLLGGDDGTRPGVNFFARPALLIVEAAESVPWTKPEDLTYDDASPSLKLGGPLVDGSYATFADGSVRFLNKACSPETLRALIKHRRS
jgi:hypothetical protein